jgi:hypothetical protein
MQAVAAQVDTPELLLDLVGLAVAATVVHKLLVLPVLMV